MAGPFRRQRQFFGKLLITQRCHKREFLLKYKQDRYRWIQWLIEAKRRFVLVVLNYVATSNHTHIIVKDDSDHRNIPQTIWIDRRKNGTGIQPAKKEIDAKRESRWTESIAVGGSPFIERKNAMGAMEKGRSVQPTEGAFELRETQSAYSVIFGPENRIIGPK